MNIEYLASLQLTFFTTRGCHLCEQAEQLLEELQQEFGLAWHSVDISSDPALVERYGIRIPVLRNEGADAELGWPFDQYDLVGFLSVANGIEPQ